MAFIFQNFPEDPKNTKIRILYPKKYDEHTYHFTIEVSPRGQISLSSIAI